MCFSGSARTAEIFVGPPCRKDDWALTVALDGGRTFTAGVGTTPRGEDFMVRVYER